MAARQGAAMRERQAILDAYGELARTGGRAVLATVVRVQGSAYRRPGARMLLLTDGITIGTVSGGCLEGDVKSARAGPSRRENRLSSATIRRRAAKWPGNWASGAKGVVDVLMERLDAGVKNGPLELLRHCLTRHEAGVIARVLAVEGHTSANVGNFLTVDQGDAASMISRNTELAGQVRVRCGEGSRGTALAVCSVSAARRLCRRLSWNQVPPPPPLIVCGAGHDAVPLGPLRQGVGWWVAVLDQPADATEEFVKRVPSASRGAAVIMSHSYRNDLHYLRALLPSPLRYLGVLGPKNRTEGYCVVSRPRVFRE